MISADPQGRISVQDLQKALAVIKHKPDEEVGQVVIQKLDVDQDGFVELEHVLGLVREEGLGRSFSWLMECLAETCIRQVSSWMTRHNLSLVRATKSRTPNLVRRTLSRSELLSGSSHFILETTPLSLSRY
jgi:hypothetical protein